MGQGYIQCPLGAWGKEVREENGVARCCCPSSVCAATGCS